MLHNSNDSTKLKLPLLLEKEILEGGTSELSGEEKESEKKEEKRGEKEEEEENLEKESSDVSKQEDDKEEENGKGDEDDDEEKNKKKAKRTKDEVLELCTKRMLFLNEQTEWKGDEVLTNIKSISRLYWSYRVWRKSVANLLVELGFPALSVKMLKYFNEVGIFQEDDVWFPAYYIYNILWNFTDSSLDLAKALSDYGLIPMLALNVSHKPYLDNMQSKNVIYLLKSSLSILQNLIKVPGNEEAYKECKLKESLEPFMESKTEFFKAISTMIVTAIINEEENKMLEDTGGVAFMVKGMRIALKQSKTRRYRGFTPIELTQCLGRMAVNDDNKKKIVGERALPLLEIMLKRDSSIEEQMSAAKTLWVLSFDKEVAENIKEEEGIMQLLEQLAKHEHAKLSKLCNGALWVLKGRAEEREQNEKNEQQHIFISYSWAQQEEVVKIKDQLKDRGFHVWFDLEQMCGSTLEAMAAGIENASVVLVCASEKYKISPNCRTEAEYTFQLKKPIIPLMLQRHYRPDGWLGIMMGAKLYINFDGKYSFDHAIMMLLKELKGVGKEEVVPVRRDPLSLPMKSEDVVDAVPMVNVKSWTSDETLDWRRRHSLLDDRWSHFLGAFDGKRLHQLHKMSTMAPDFFYKYMTETVHLELTEVFDLANALEEL